MRKIRRGESKNKKRRKDGKGQKGVEEKDEKREESKSYKGRKSYQRNEINSTIRKHCVRQINVYHHLIYRYKQGLIVIRQGMGFPIKC